MPVVLSENVRSPHKDRGEIRIRAVLEITGLLLVVYIVIQLAPAVATRINFLNELEVIANSPIQDTDAELRQRVLQAGRDRGIALSRDNIFVQRDRALRKTIIDTSYQLRVDFLPGLGFDWHVTDHVEALLL